MPEDDLVGLLGGTGPLGRGLAGRLAQVGCPVLVGSRDPDRAAQLAAELSAELGAGAQVLGAGNSEVAVRAELIFVTVPYAAVRDTVLPLAAALRGKVLVSTAVPMEFRDRTPQPLPVAAGSAALELARDCPGAEVVAALHTVSAPLLLERSRELSEDTLVSGDAEAAKRRVAELISRIPGLRAVDAGPLASSGLTEQLTPLLLRLNRIHHGHAGIRVTGI